MAGPRARLPSAEAGPGAARTDAVAAGRLKGDLTVFNWGDGTWWLMASYYLLRGNLRRFANRFGPDERVAYPREVAGR